MPPYIPGVSRRELIRILRRLNFRESQGGEHTVFHHHRLGLRTSVPRPSGEVFPRTVGAITEQIGLTRAEFDQAHRSGGRIPERFRE